jgi:tRNA-dihydrouridine synthase A
MGHQQHYNQHHQHKQLVSQLQRRSKGYLLLLVLLFSFSMKSLCFYPINTFRLGVCRRKKQFVSSNLGRLKTTPPSAKSTFSTAAAPDEDEERQRRRQKNYNLLMDATKLSLAPMMEYTDRHFRHLVRLISSKTLLYTEMVAANAIAHERQACEDMYMVDHPNASPEDLRQGYSHQYLQRYLAQGQVTPLEGASVLQLGGSDAKQMLLAAETVLDMSERGLCDYTAINLNCGCPSPKVAGKGCFGAALMDEPKLVSELTKALHDGTRGTLPITVKCRIGTDSNRPFTKTGYAETGPEEAYQKLCEFIETVASNGVVTDFSVHARIAVLQKSFSPADNRKIPPLRYDVVRRLVQDYPEFTFSLNGGIETISQAQAEFEACPGLAGVMIGRSWAADPWSFAMADRILYNAPMSASKNRLQVLQAYGEHADWEEVNSDPVKIRRFITKAISPLFTGEPNAKRFRIALDEIAAIPKKLHAQGKTMQGQPPISELILNAALEHLSEDVLLRSPEESYDRKLASERNNNNTNNPGQWSDAVAEWQKERKNEADESTASASAAA